jgi:hypothetical protein
MADSTESKLRNDLISWCLQNLCFLNLDFGKLEDRQSDHQHPLFSGFDGLGVPKFAGSNPAEAVEIFRAKKASARLLSEGKYNSWSHVVDLRHVKDP